MVALEPNGHTTGRLDHPDPEEVEENDFKHNFMKMVKLEEIKKSLQEHKKNKKKQSTCEGNSSRLEDEIEVIKKNKN